MDSDSTFADVREGTSIRKPWARRAGTALLAAFILLGALGTLGPRTDTITATEGDVTVTVQYARVARPGHDVPLVVTIHRVGGFTGPVDVALDPDYLAMFESQRFAPEPSDETGDGELLQFSFDPPAGETFEFEFDAYIEPGWQRGKKAVVALIGDSGELIAPVEFRTTVVP